MASLEEFESTLKEVVQAKRLSASKMTKLTEIALKSMEHDTQLVSVLYRTHKSLKPAAKVSSLYVFDALSRAARHQVNKQGITGDISSPTGNAATFLLKVEGILEGLFQDMVAVGSPEAKEKTQKILDIWVKGNTFPPKILSRLTDVVKEAEKVPEVQSMTTSDPRMVAAPQPLVSTPTPPAAPPNVPPPAPDPQATLLALLAQAANAVNPQTIANTGVATGFDAAQLAVLQQLALAQTASSAAPSQPAPPQAPPAQSGSASAYPTPPSYREEPDNSHHKDRRFNGPQSSDRVNPYDDQPEDRSSSRGFRGGLRGRGRGRWDDRDRDRCRERERDDRSSSYRGRRSRSRSPPYRQGGRRPVRPYSPPRRPNHASISSRGQDATDSGPTRGDNDGKDEFGRDIRPKSPESDATLPPKHDTPKSPPPPPASAPPPVAKQPAVEPTPALSSNHDRMSLSPLVAANTSSSTPSAPFVSSTVSPQPGLEKFNPATFDFTSPASWEALGKMWQVTNGYLPSTEELMQFVISGGQPAFGSAPTPTQGHEVEEDSGTAMAEVKSGLKVTAIKQRTQSF
ncbi:putative RPR [Lyophyllum shimeji]|uniref:RPR n=1 Tax=Lyophyllum shimeji TaxID=47721 RepID=A0A9P3PU86_LYOSH|nr:putative RPR [Lyophyllum shimeji]